LSAALSVPSAALAQAPSGTADCRLSGITEVQKNLKIYDQQSGGEVLAEFSGVPTALSVSDFPTRPDGTRAKVTTGSSSGGFEISGFLDPAQLSLVSTKQVPIEHGHLWINAGASLEFNGKRPGALRVVKQVKTSLHQRFEAWAPCDSLGFGRQSLPAWDLPGSARGYMSNGSQVKLYDAPGGTALYTLKPAAWSDGVLFWSTEARAGYVHVLLHDDLVVDAWVPRGQLDAMPKGERFDRLAPSGTRRNPPRLQLSEKPREFRAKKNISLSLQASSKARKVGHIRPGTEVYVIDVMARWASVLPKSLDLVAPGGGQFWIEASEIPK
jgi:hypothetical protein